MTLCWNHTSIWIRWQANKHKGLSMSDIFREVDEALQEDKAKEFWQEWGSTLITAALAMVISTGLFSGYRTWQSAEKEKETSRVMQALDEEAAVPALLEIAGDSKKAQQTIAVFTAAGLLLQDGKFEEAAKAYEDAANNNNLVAELEDLARIMAVRIRMGEATDEAAAEPFLDMLAPALKNKKSPWHYHATTEAAMVEAEFNSNYAKAAEMIDEVLNADNAPRDLKERSAAMQHVFKLQAAKQPKQPEKQEG